MKCCWFKLICWNLKCKRGGHLLTLRSQRLTFAPLQLDTWTLLTEYVDFTLFKLQFVASWRWGSCRWVIVEVFLRNYISSYFWRLFSWINWTLLTDSVKFYTSQIGIFCFLRLSRWDLSWWVVPEVFWETIFLLFVFVEHFGLSCHVTSSQSSWRSFLHMHGWYVHIPYMVSKN